MSSAPHSTLSTMPSSAGVSSPLDGEALLKRLPVTRGRMRTHVSMGEMSWFGTGGDAEVLFKPVDREDLCAFLAGCPDDVPITVLGVASNVIIRDGGLKGVVIRLGRAFAGIDVEADTGIVRAGAAALDANVAKQAASWGCAGLEFLSGVPGTIGGALRMNAGAYGRETVDALIEAEAIDRDGNVHRYHPDQMDMSYRYNGIPSNFVFTEAVFKTSKDDPQVIAQRIEEIKEKRANTQPIKEKTGGSTFANPSIDQLRKAGLADDMKTWQLIDGVGGRGLMIGGAQMSEQHCNFMINANDASASDLERLGEEIRRRVLDHYGVELRWEIKRIGLHGHDVDDNWGDVQSVTGKA